MNKNPFSLTFGKEPTNMISRFAQSNEILETFKSKSPSQQIYMITGVRGCGKTVFMTSIAKSLETDSEWIVIELNSAGELLKELAAKLYNTRGLSKLFDSAGINLSFWGIGINIKKAPLITDLGTAIERMLGQIAKNNKRVLITIDEVSNTSEMRTFAGAFQILVRHELPVYLLMTGLYENINRLQNEDNLTFLYRAPRIQMNALNTSRMADSYEKSLSLPKETSLQMATMTKGYSFAFQVLGYFTYECGSDYIKALPDVKQYLEEYVYDKIWSELSEREKMIVNDISYSDMKDVKSIKESLNIKPNEFSVYRSRLIKKGILTGSRRGYLSFTLPFFDEYVRNQSWEA